MHNGIMGNCHMGHYHLMNRQTDMVENIDILKFLWRVVINASHIGLIVLNYKLETTVKFYPRNFYELTSWFFLLG